MGHVNQGYRKHVRSSSQHVKTVKCLESRSRSRPSCTSLTHFFDVGAELDCLVDGGGVGPLVGVSAAAESEFNLKKKFKKPFNSNNFLTHGSYPIKLRLV
jgi:hypothetical protein